MLAVAREKPQTTFKWRPYQADCLDAADRVLREDGANPICVIPTGGGKGPLAGEIASRFIQRTKCRVVIATHVKELVVQNFKQVRKVAPHLSVGIYSASVGRKDMHAQVTVANVQSIVNAARFFLNVGLLIIDEAHLLQHGEDGQYHDLIKALRKNHPSLKVLGLTATPWRTDSGNLTEPYKGIDPLFNEVAYEIGIGELVADGYLTRLVARATKVQQSTTGVARRGGEFVVGDLDKAVNADPLNEAITEEALLAIGNRGRVLDFCVSIDHAKRVAETWRRRGVAAAYVSGEMDQRLRDRTIDDFKRGRTRVLANCGILTTGFDDASVDCILHRRPTNSPGLYLQICGRGTRVIYDDGHDLETREGRLAAIANGGKPDCLLLDFAGNTKRHGLVDAVQGVFKKGKEADASDNLRECPKCQTYNAKEDAACIQCGHVFVKSGGAPTAADREAKLHKQNMADSAMGAPLQEFAVLGMRYSPHEKKGSPKSFKLSFSVPGEPWPISQWLCFDHDGWIQKKARQQWRQFAENGSPPPRSVDEACARVEELRYPTRIWARKDANGMWRIEGVNFSVGN